MHRLFPILALLLAPALPAQATVNPCSVSFGQQTGITLADPNAKTNHDNWQTGGTVKTILHSLAGVLQAKVGNGKLLAEAAVGGTSGAATAGNGVVNNFLGHEDQAE